jgi:uncharacterized protein (TIRG00374 family)
MNKIVSKIIKVVISVVLVIGSMYWAMKNVNFADLIVILKNVNYLWVIITIPIVLLSHWVRAIRWKTMLKPIMNVGSTYNLFSAVMVGYFFNNIIPRGGEFIRPYVYSKREKVSFSSLFATILVERVLDVLFLMIIFACVFAFSNRILNILPKDIDPKYLIILALLFVFILLSTFFPPIVHFLLKTFIKPISNKFYERASEIFVKLEKGFSIIKKPSQYLRLSAESLFIWLLYSLPLYFIFFAFPFQIRLGLGIEDAIMLVIVAGVGVSIAPSPGAIGVYHALITTAMTQLYNISSTEAFAYATVTHAMSRIVELTVGAAFFFRENLKGFPSNEMMNEEIKE